MAKPLGSHLLVAIQFSSIALGLIPFTAPSGSLGWLAASGLGVIAGLYTLLHNRLGNFGVYPEPLGHAQLITSGPYQWVRHPMYLAVLLFMLGIAMYNGHWINQLSLITLTLAIIGKMNREEAYLREHFDEYGDYCSGSRRLLPFLY
jgi:protein-S-isoprenylcysteine O-methyltransferase Ste14